MSLSTTSARFATTTARVAVLAALVVGASTQAQNSQERFQAYNDGTVKDNQTGLTWAAEDNGNDIDWPKAQQYCQSKGAGWRLPNVNELLALYNTNPDDTQECMGLLTCKITPKIKVSGLTPWSAERNSDSEAWYVYFNDGKQYAYTISSTQGKRALCVK